MGLSLKLGLGLSSGGTAATSALAFSAGRGIDATADSETEPVSETGFTVVDPHPDRYVVVLVTGLLNYVSGVATPTCTINGVSATRFSYAVSTVFSSFRNVVAGFYAKVPTGATADVVLSNFTTSNAATGDLAIGVYSFSNLGGSVGVIDSAQTAAAANTAMSVALAPTAAGQLTFVWGHALNGAPGFGGDWPSFSLDVTGDIRTNEVAKIASLVTTGTGALSTPASAAVAAAGVVLG